MSAIHFAELYEAEGYLDKAPNWARWPPASAFEPDTAAPPAYDHFFQRPPLLVATR